MRRKFRKEKRLSSFLFRFGSFFLIIICHDGVNSSIHFLRYSDGSTGTAKYKSFVAFDLLSTEACQLLDLIFFQEESSSNCRRLHTPFASYWSSEYPVYAFRDYPFLLGCSRRNYIPPQPLESWYVRLPYWQSDLRTWDSGSAHQDHHHSWLFCCIPPQTGSD